MPHLGAGQLALVQQLVGALRRLKQRIIAVALHHQDGGRLDVAVGDHR